MLSITTEMLINIPSIVCALLVRSSLKLCVGLEVILSDVVVWLVGYKSVNNSELTHSCKIPGRMIHNIAGYGR